MALGNINKCLNPQRIYNKYIDEVMYVPCRKCLRCRDTYASNWARRIDEECKHHRYSLFVTLTYDNDHLPVFEPQFDENGRSLSYWCSNRSFESGKFVKATDCVGCPVPQQMDCLCFGYPVKKDVQDFIKRLRSRIDYRFRNEIKINGNNKQYRIRYFICAEYGPVTFRPHYHAILWYDSPDLAFCIDRLLCESWSFGHTDFSLVNSSASSYVAKYVNGNTNLPPVLQTEFTRTFHLASKHPYIGYSEIEEQALEDNVLNGTYGRDWLNPKSNLIEHLPTSRSLENRRLPKCRGYRSLSHSQRVRVYSLAYDYEQLGLDYRCLLPYDFDYQAYPFLDIHCSLVCLDWCHKFSMTPEIFVSLLEDYYYRKDMYLLKTQYEYQEEYVNRLHLPVWHLVDFDLTLFERLPYYRYDFLSSRYRLLMSTFGLDANILYCNDGLLNTEILDCFRQKGSPFYKHNVCQYRKIHDDSLKNKRMNEHLFKERFL